MFGKSKKQLRRNIEELLNELHNKEEELKKEQTAYDILYDKYVCALKQRDEYKQIIDSAKAKNRERQTKYRAKKKAGK